tara:strand:+ start:237 stop:506 length:270 start_codon:yes stop_codon:yes gene_type:complete
MQLGLRLGIGIAAVDVQFISVAGWYEVASRLRAMPSKRDLAVQHFVEHAAPCRVCPDHRSLEIPDAACATVFRTLSGAAHNPFWSREEK